MMKKQSKDLQPVMVSYCTQDTLQADFCYSLAGLVAYSVARNIYIGIHDQRTSVIDIGRQLQVIHALKSNASHLLMIDSDMWFPSNALERLLARNKDVIGVTYTQRRPPRGYTHESMRSDFSLPSDPREEVFEVKSLGCGMLLVRTEVFRALERPWFRHTYSGYINEDGSDAHRSEDRSFCDKARAAGFRVWCDYALSREVKHVGTFRFGLEHAEVIPNYSQYL